MKQLKNSEVKNFREEMLLEQNNICPLCEQHINKNDACLDHDHTTGEIRGVLHSNCNSLEGVIKSRFTRSGVHKLTDLITYLNNLIVYLQKEHHKVLHPSNIPKPKKLKKSSYNYLKKMYSKSNDKRHKKKFPDYPKSKKLIKRLDELYFELFITPEYYEGRN